MAARRKGPWLRWPTPQVVAFRPSGESDVPAENDKAQEEGFTPTTVFVLPSSLDLRESIRASGKDRKPELPQRLTPRKMP